MKRVFLSISVLFFLSASYSQSVENLMVEPAGDKINIHYRIAGSTDKQFFTIRLTCSIDGGARFEPKTVRGAVGPGIMGGKDNYTITWDVFKDVEEVGSAEFFVRAELEGRSVETERRVSETGSVQPISVTPLNGKPVPASNVSRAVTPRKTFVSYELSYWLPYGVRAGTLGNWGFYGCIKVNGSGYGSITGGATKLIVNQPKYRLHGYTGVGVGNVYDNFTVEFGFSNVIYNRLLVNLGWEYWPGIVLGIGIVF